MRDLDKALLLARIGFGLSFLSVCVSVLAVLAEERRKSAPGAVGPLPIDSEEVAPERAFGVDGQVHCCASGVR